MMNLREYRRSTTQLADFLPWAALVDEGVVLNKDGSFQRTAKFRGPDLDSAVPAELVGVAGRLNNALRRLGSGWAVFVEAQRNPASNYPEGHFPDVASALVDVERRAEFEQEGAHYESNYFLTFLYLPPAEETARAESLLYEGRDRSGDGDAREVQRGFVDRTERILGLVEGFMPEITWLDDEGTLTYLHSTVSTRRQRVRVPEIPMYLDAVLADEPLIGGLEPMLGQSHLRVLTLVGFPRRRRCLSSVPKAMVNWSIIASGRIITSSTGCSPRQNCAWAASTNRRFGSVGPTGEHVEHGRDRRSRCR
jgi:type IV secretory pathway VirB4 component